MTEPKTLHAVFDLCQPFLFSESSFAKGTASSENPLSADLDNGHGLGLSRFEADSSTSCNIQPCAVAQQPIKHQSWIGLKEWIVRSYLNRSVSSVLYPQLPPLGLCVKSDRCFQCDDGPRWKLVFRLGQREEIAGGDGKERPVHGVVHFYKLHLNEDSQLPSSEHIGSWTETRKVLKSVKPTSALTRPGRQSACRRVNSQERFPLLEYHVAEPRPHLSISIASLGNLPMTCRRPSIFLPRSMSSATECLPSRINSCI